MAVSIEIKHNAKRKLTVTEIAQLQGLNYGILTSYYTLERNKIGDYTILYDSYRIGRGIELSVEESSIHLRLSLPTTISEIELFYDLTVTICEKLKIKQFLRDEETAFTNHIQPYIDADKEASLNALLDIEKKINTNETNHFIVFGALNPISLGNKEMKEINRSLEAFENLLNRLQQMDVYYATPSFYQRKNGTIFGIYFVGEEITSVIPLKPSVPFQSELKPDSFYVSIPGRNHIPYDDFIANVKQIDNYDNDHIIVELDEASIRQLVEKYNVEINTNEKQKGIYMGKSYDEGYRHFIKIKNKQLPVEAYSAYNHIAIYVKWCAKHYLLSEIVLSAHPELSNITEDIDIRVIIHNSPIFQSGLKKDHFNELGKKFTETYYNNPIKGLGSYVDCVDLYAQNYFEKEVYESKELKNEAYLFVPYDERYYKGLSESIEKAWTIFNEKTGEK